MGIAGVANLDNDSFCETVELFREKLLKGQQPREIARCIAEEYADVPDFLVVQLALLECLWHCNQLTAKDIQKAEQDGLIEADALYWITNTEDEALREKRKDEIQKFFRKIKQPPNTTERWKDSTALITIPSGTVFWYRASHLVYGAVVLDICDGDIYFIALSEALASIPQCIDDVLESPLYTAAWFGSDSILAERQRHIVGRIEVTASYSGRAGLLRDDRQSSCQNVGQAATWKHNYRSFYKADSLVKSTLSPAFFPKTRAIPCV